MEFRLSYRGELKANGDRQHKHELRRHFHGQLAELWKQSPLVNRPEFAAEMTKPGQVSLSIMMGTFRFVPLVSTRLYAIADLEVLLLRPGPPGHLLSGGGDIDNRLKTLLDSLKVPDENALPVGIVPGPSESPFYCLLEDDKLVTGIRVETDRLLDPQSEREVLLVIRVATRYTQATWANMGL